MLRFAAALATKHGIKVPSNVTEDFELCRQFLDKWSKAVVNTALGAKPPSVTPVLSPTSAAPFDAPTEKQLAYAKSIAARKKLDIPAAALKSKREISLWIDQNRA